jgi:hypothetical protein
MGEHGLDFEGFRRFGLVASMLEEDREPDASAWDELFAVPGYVALTRGEFKRETMMDRWRAALMPCRRKERDELLAAGYRLVAHAVHVREHWAELEAVTERLSRRDLGPQALALAAALLPEPAPRDVPPISFLIFLNDSRGYVPVVIDVVNAAACGDDLVLLLAHEFHHYFRNRILTYNRTSVAPCDEDLMWMLDQIHAEGVADLIDKPGTLYGAGAQAGTAWAADYRRAVEEAPTFLRDLDVTLSGLAEARGEERVGPCRELRGRLLWSGHPVGYHMARALAGAGLREELRRTVGDPWAFFDMYDRLHREAGQRVFSEGTLALLSGLRARYRSNS